MAFKEILFSFFAGGGLIAIVLAAAKIFGPLIAGIIAALPVRLGTTLFISGISYSPDFVLGMLRGSIPTSMGAFAFMIVLAKTTGKLGIVKSFLLACFVCVLIIYSGLMIS